MCERCDDLLKIDYTVPITLNAERRLALGKAFGLIKFMAEKADPGVREQWKHISDQLELVAEEIRQQLRVLHESLNS